MAGAAQSNTLCLNGCGRMNDYMAVADIYCGFLIRGLVAELALAAQGLEMLRHSLASAPFWVLVVLNEIFLCNRKSDVFASKENTLDTILLCFMLARSWPHIGPKMDRVCQDCLSKPQTQQKATQG